MFRFINKISLFLLFSAVFLPAGNLSAQSLAEEVFDAKILEVMQEQKTEGENGVFVTQQNLRLKGLSGAWKDKEFVYAGISDLNVLNMSNVVFKKGDKVTVNYLKDINGEDQFYILNYVRRGYIYLLGIIFSLAIVLVGKKKGARSLLSLIVSFFVITKFIVPKIVSGSNPLVISLVGSILILSLIIYITDGFNRKTNIALISIASALSVTFILSIIFVKLTKLTGFASEETTFLLGLSGNNIIDFRGLLLAGILIGTLGVLDDAILSQVEAVNQIKKINPNLSKMEVIKSANEIGRTHLGAMVNTLFLTYAGVSLPLLILFNLGSVATINLGSVIDNEFIATEIVRTLSGSIGLILAFPITTYITASFLNSKK